MRDKLTPPAEMIPPFAQPGRLRDGGQAAKRDGGGARTGCRPVGAEPLVALLEHRLGVRLFVRSHPVRCSHRPGRSTTMPSSNSPAPWPMDSTTSPEMPTPTVRISASPGLSRLWLSKRLVRFQALFPRIDLSLAVSESLSDVLGHQTDIALRYGGIEEPGTVSVPLWRETISPVARPDIAASTRGVSLESLVTRFPSHRARALELAELARRA